MTRKLDLIRREIAVLDRRAERLAARREALLRELQAVCDHAEVALVPGERRGVCRVCGTLIEQAHQGEPATLADLINLRDLALLDEANAA